MTSHELPAIRSTIAPLDLYSALGEALWAVLGEQPKRESVLCLQAHHKVENGDAAWCWNLANVRRHGDGDFCTLPFCSEIERGSDNVAREIFYARDASTAASLAATGKHAQISAKRCQFAAYGSLQDGASAYVAMLQTMRYARSWAAMLTGEPAAFASALHIDGWYTAAVGPYTRLMVASFDALDKSLPTM